VVSESLKLPARDWRDYLEQAGLSIDHDYVVELREIGTHQVLVRERLWQANPLARLLGHPNFGYRFERECEVPPLFWLHAHQHTFDATGLSASPAELPIPKESSVTDIL
jgi:hypothetical protein